ncbi:MAG: hypothetical protein PHR77_09125 [Kiritimatiellae bacterium]|nr:hypothetical protein [Kiritimatiellia bacterium]MDD5520747.1 hypothetical protein [Kiritimatiellia bacterium]
MKKNTVMTFGDDVLFLKKYVEVIVLSDSTGQGKVCLVPALQGRVMTSSAEGDKGSSYGWINYELCKSGKIMPHINVYGGEDRFWLGPEGGQFSVFFKKGVPFDLDHWYTPKCVDTEPFDVVLKSKNSVAFKKDVQMDNYSGTVFNLRIDREVRILDEYEAVKELGVKMDKSVKIVAYQSRNRITNTGKNTWDKQSGMLSIWILGMFNPSPSTTIVIPYNPGNEQDIGPVVNDAYFGKVPADRLIVKDKAIFFSGDGQYRSKIGLSPKRAKPVLGSYDVVNKVLTIVKYSKPEGVSDYVNSMWEVQKKPFDGDVVNSYNDGPPQLGAKPLGPFYELESSSPAAALKPGESLSHVHQTVHLVGAEDSLDNMAKTVLGVGLDEIKNGLKK